MPPPEQENNAGAEGNRLRLTRPWPPSHPFMKRFLPWRREGTSHPYLQGWTLARPKNRSGMLQCAHAPSCVCTPVLDNSDRQRRDF